MSRSACFMFVSSPNGPSYIAAIILRCKENPVPASSDFCSCSHDGTLEIVDEGKISLSD